MQNEVEDEWLEFLNTGNTTLNSKNIIDCNEDRNIDKKISIPKSSDIYISTKTKIS